ncbi:heat shock 70 kDa protein 12B-like, partial [Phasianus colchicus]|uniref:heat shock 70 kDa protein 12B-like n=1 Tax=Phasianus colchicus TaxID=9054 RepID=UPI00129D4A73
MGGTLSWVGARSCGAIWGHPIRDIWEQQLQEYRMGPAVWDGGTAAFGVGIGRGGHSSALPPLQDLSVRTELEAANGRKVAALEVFAHALRFFKQHAVQELREQSPALPESGAIRWVLTVPAVWKQPAKLLMREAAYR